MTKNLHIAVDLGAGSGRVFIASFDKEFFLEEIHRFTYPPIEENGHLRWDFPKIFGEIKNGLAKGSVRANELNKDIYSIGVDTWGVDYGLLDENGELLENPVCYRDARTENWSKYAFKRLSREQVFQKTGIQFLPFNTIFQLFNDEKVRWANKVLLIPDLINFFLTGKQFVEYTNATTTQLINAETCNWDSDLFAIPHLDVELMPEIISSGTDLGSLKTEIAEELNLPNVHVIAPATHDTGSAVAGLPLEKDWAYISSGTWSLVGVEIDKPLINEEVAKFNFTNEGGVYGTIRFLKNVMGLWILESCRKEWEKVGETTDYETLLADVAKIEGFCGFIFPDDDRFLNPSSMIEAIENQLYETGQVFNENPSYVTKIILDSLAFRYASILGTIEKLTGKKIEGVQIAGGGGKNNYLSQMTANACSKKIKTGLTEATVTGNLLVQAISAGRFPDLKTARNFVAENVELKEFTPQTTTGFDEAKSLYQSIEAKFLGN